jgi:hypothetical protein
MMKIYKSALVLVTLLGASLSNAQDLVHYWNFNDNTSIATLTTPTLSLVPGAAITATNNVVTTLIDPAGGTGQNFNVLNLNAQNGDAPGTHLRYNEPLGGYLEFALPTTGFDDIVVRFSTRRSGSGADDQLWFYSTDGGGIYQLFSTIHPANGDPTLQTLDFTAITDANDNADFKLKVEFAQGAGGNVGNNRFDNFTVNGTSIGGDTNEPVVTIAPADEATNVAIDANMTISFNEDVRLLNNDAIDDTNVDAIVEVRLGDALGALVPFDATFAGNVITINPTADFDNNQEYYVALLANTVEDLSDNAVADVSASIFTTIAAQEAFTAGDFAFVAYRMSATGTEDEVAFVTFIDIPDGTNINLTDGKYTTNTQPQCAGGIVWTAQANSCIPAGSVIRIQTNALTSNMGTVTGAGFGLSSNGDQVMVYTGTADAPNYITALTSNGWVATNTECGGSLSMLPAGLTDGTSTLNMSTAPGNVAGNTANGFYNGTNDGEPSALRALILDPANWTTSPASTAAQVWPTWAFPKALQVTGIDADESGSTIVITFDAPVNPVSGADIFNYMGIDNLGTATVAGNQVTLSYTTGFPLGINSLMIADISGTVAQGMACPYLFEFEGTLATETFNKNSNAFVLYPNPSENGIVYFNRSASVTVFDTTGKLLLSINDAKSIDTSLLSSGLYLVKTSEGNSVKLVVR